MVGFPVSPSQPKRWVKGNAVGAGSFGVVNMAMNTCTGELFVVKSSSSETQFRALQNEANLLKNLDSPYIVRFLGQEFSNEVNGERNFNLFMEYMANGTLSDVMEKFGNVEESVIRSYTREILLGLAYLHRNGIVHCDLKCKNILLGSRGNIKLADFGCAKRLGCLDEKKICGTPLWMAPEVLRNERLELAADIWSLGCTIIEMVTGKPPWEGDVTNPMAAVLKIASSDELPQFPKELSKEGLNFLDKCLQRDPKKRCTAQELLSHPFVTADKEVAISPVSVLDVGSCESDYESDESNSSEKEAPRKIPFSSRQRKGLSRKQSKDPDFVPSDDWITVRSS